MTIKESNELLKIKAVIHEMGLLFNQYPGEEKINAYAKQLINYSPMQIVYAFRKVMKSGSDFFPSLPKVLSHLMPMDESRVDMAPQVAAEIMDFIRTYGAHEEARMLHVLSDEAQATLLRYGNTQTIRMSENAETTRAQIERLARSVIQKSEATQKNEELKAIGITKGKILSLPSNGMKVIDYTDNSPLEGE